jgi:hypothetical protein
MCNPRRVQVRATRTISEQWRAEIARTAEASGTVAGEARLECPLATMLAPAALAAFVEAVRDDDQWVFADGVYRLAVPGGQVTFDPAGERIEIVVRLTEQLRTEGHAERVVTGAVDTEVTAEGEATYYTDGFAGRTRAVAEREAEQAAAAAAEANAARERETLTRAGRERAQEAMRADAGRVQAEAEADAQRRYADAAETRTAALRGEADARLAEIHRQTLDAVFRTMAAGYRAAIVRYARQNNAENLSVTESGDVVEIQFEMEA